MIRNAITLAIVTVAFIIAAAYIPIILTIALWVVYGLFVLHDRKTLL